MELRKKLFVLLVYYFLPLALKIKENDETGIIYENLLNN